ncbi:MAG: hypothetical protein L0241_25340 [Planctomycetia bacterium]|nr:hypothetical protein [Planctomycetia bacterium]
MKLSHSLSLALFACLCVAVMALPAWADLPGPGPRPRPGPPIDPIPRPMPPAPAPNGEEVTPQPPPPPIDPITGKELFDTREKKSPQRTGPFRSCGSGMGLGLAGIGLAWGMFWLGNRFAARVSRGTNEERTR